MKAFKRILTYVSLFVAIFMVTSCDVARIKDIKIVSAGVKYVVPTSLRSFDSVLLLGVDNPAMTLNVSGVEGLIKADQQPLASFTASEMVLEGKKSLRYELPCTVTLEPGVTLLDVLKLSAKRSLEGITLDVSMTVSNKKGKMKTPVSFKDIDLSEFSK